MSDELAKKDSAEVMSFPNLTTMQEAIHQNLDGERLSVKLLSKISVPGAGSTTWELPSGEPAKEFKGVILDMRHERLYYREDFSDTGGGKRPDCKSDDCITGKIGQHIEVDDSLRSVITGQCETCPLAVYGSGKDEKGSACRERRRMYILLEGMLLPVIVDVSISSLQDLVKYKFDLTGFGLKYSEVVTVFSLSPDKTKKGVPYAKIAFKSAGKLLPEQVTELDKIRASMITMFNVQPD